jgi:hypothetical protein
MTLPAPPAIVDRSTGNGWVLIEASILSEHADQCHKKEFCFVYSNNITTVAVTVETENVGSLKSWLRMSTKEVCTLPFQSTSACWEDVHFGLLVG